MREKSVCLALLLYFPVMLPALISLDGSFCGVDHVRRACDRQGGDRNPYCRQEMSASCHRTQVQVPEHCFDTLGEVKNYDVCVLQNTGTEERCGTVSPRHITPPDEPLVNIYLYHNHHSQEARGQEALVNLTFPDPKWKEIELQYTFLNSAYSDFCLNFTLRKPVNTTLMYDCRAKQPPTPTPTPTPTPVRLTVQTDTGRGASYLFMIPEGARVNPRETCPLDWHVFFYVPQDALHRRQPLPVTVQSSPYGRVTYRIALATCLDGSDEQCRNFTELQHVSVTRNTSDVLWVVELPGVTTPGHYIVTVQMVADWCVNTPLGCHVSVSPRLEIPSSSTWLVLLMSVLLILMLVASILVMFCQRWRVNKNLLTDMENNQPTVLLTYHPESRAAYYFVTTLAKFLENTCYVTCLMADGENGVGNEHPNHWTKRHMSEASRVLFIVPKDGQAQSYTPIRYQWSAALKTCNGHDFTTSRQAKRVAKLLHPASGDVPWQIQDIRRFQLSHNPAVLVNWLHGGSFLDQIFFWRPHVRSASEKNTAPTWKDVKQAAQQINNAAATTPNAESPPLPPPPPVRVEVEPDKESGGESIDGDDDASVSLAFDSEIPGFNQVSQPSEENISTPENSSDEDEGVYQ